jgi:simple sugar transport system permease protein
MSTELILSLTSLLAIGLGYAIPLIFASMGELVVEKSGVLNLGVEGMMIVGAVTAFSVTVDTGSVWLGLLAGGIAGTLISVIFAVLAIHLLTRQVPTGLALTIFGLGLSGYLGKDLVGKTVPDSIVYPVPILKEIPILGDSLFTQTLPGYLAIIIGLVVVYVLAKTRIGLIVRAVGESPEVAHSIGFSVRKTRYAATLFGGLMAGLGGGYIALIQQKFWVENMTAGIGWIALILVVFSSWKPFRLILGAIFFGIISGLSFYMQAKNYPINPNLLNSMPFIASMVVLCITSANSKRSSANAPASLGQSYHS